MTARPVAADVPATRPSPQIVSWLGDLGDSDASVREAARYGLMGLEREQLPHLAAAVRSAGSLQPSQLAVLRDIIVHVLLSGETYEAQEQKAFMGIRFELSPSQSGLVIVQRFPGFAANRELREGDMVLQVEDDPRPLDNTSVFIQMIEGRQPGDQVRLRVLRQGQALLVTVRLHPRPAAALNDPQGLKMLQFERDRLLLAEQYWQETFVPLLQDATL